MSNELEQVRRGPHDLHSLKLIKTTGRNQTPVTLIINNYWTALQTLLTTLSRTFLLKQLTLSTPRPGPQVNAGFYILPESVLLFHDISHQCQKQQPKQRFMALRHPWRAAGPPTTYTL